MLPEADEEGKKKKSQQKKENRKKKKTQFIIKRRKREGLQFNAILDSSNLRQATATCDDDGLREDACTTRNHVVATFVGLGFDETSRSSNESGLRSEAGSELA